MLGAYVPGAHSWQAPWLAPLYAPAWHAVHAPGPVAALSELYVPAMHAVHEVALVRLAYVPGGHSVQAAGWPWVALLKLPGGQAVHTAAVDAAATEL